MRSYERSIYNSLLENGVEPSQAEVLMRDFYPIVYKISRGEIDPEEYVNMLMGVIVKDLTLDDVKSIVYGVNPKLKRITRVFPTVRFKLLLEFDDCEYRVAIIKELPIGVNSPGLEVINDIDMFKTAKVDKECGTVVWGNGVDLPSDVLYENSYPIVL